MSKHQIMRVCAGVVDKGCAANYRARRDAGGRGGGRELNQTAKSQHLSCSICFAAARSVGSGWSQDNCLFANTILTEQCVSLMPACWIDKMFSAL